MIHLTDDRLIHSLLQARREADRWEAAGSGLGALRRRDATTLAGWWRERHSAAPGGLGAGVDHDAAVGSAHGG